MEQIGINGLLWDTKNLEIDGKKYFQLQEAMSVAKILGKRLPTREEFQALIDSGWEYDQEKKGMWFADRKLFFPLSGWQHYTSGALSNTDYGYLWSSSPKDDSRSWYLYFTDGDAYMSYCNTMNGFPVRCVQDKPLHGYCKSSISLNNNELNSITTSLSKDIDIQPPLEDGTEEMDGTALDRQIDGNHYKDLAIQPVEYIHKNNMNFIQGCIIKYISRYKQKGGKKDLLKIKHFVDLLIEFEYPEKL